MGAYSRAGIISGGLISYCSQSLTQEGTKFLTPLHCKVTQRLFSKRNLSVNDDFFNVITKVAFPFACFSTIKESNTIWPLSCIILQLCFPQIRPHGGLIDGGMFAKLIYLEGGFLRRGLIWRGAYSRIYVNAFKLPVHFFLSFIVHGIRLKRSQINSLVISTLILISSLFSNSQSA